MSKHWYSLSDHTVSDHEVELALPIWVFGTLRPRYGNDRLWHGAADSAYDGQAVLSDHRLVSNGAFPYCLPAEGESTRGTLIIPHIGEYREVLQNMDYLEGVPTHYARRSATIRTPDGLITSWMYRPDHWEEYAEYPPVPGNDWAQAGTRRVGRNWWES